MQIAAPAYDEHDQSSESAWTAPPPELSTLADPDRVTRLLCARLYLFGLATSLPTLLRLEGRAVQSRALNLGMDDTVVTFHAWQSLLLSAAWAIPSVAIYCLAPPDSSVWALGLYLWVGLKLALVNPLIARLYFQDGTVRTLRLPFLTWLVRHLTRWRYSQHDQHDVVYFRRWKPFVGFGEELNAWTIVVDATRPRKGLGMNDPVRVQPEPQGLYEAVRSRCRSLGTEFNSVRQLYFVDGRRAHVAVGSPRRYVAPPTCVNGATATALNRGAPSGRAVQMLVGQSGYHDVIVTQSIRFSMQGRLLFCEFSSLLLPPAGRGLTAQDRLFRLWLPLYLLFGCTIAWAAGLLASIVAPLTETLLWMDPGVYLRHLTSLTPEYWSSFVFLQALGYWSGYRIVGLVLTWCVLLLTWRSLTELVARLAIFLGIRENYGVALSLREYWASKKTLDYFELQETIRLLKTHEKIIISAVCEYLEWCGVDASDFEEKVSTFINQGVINSGEVRGNIISKVAQIALRRGRKQRIKTRQSRYVAIQ